MPPAPRKLNRGAFYPKGLEYQDVSQRPTLLTVAYYRCLQHWAEKHHLPISPEARPLARSMRELLLAVGEFMHITARDVLEGLNMNQPKNAAPPPFVPLFSQVLSPPVDKQEAMPVPEETSRANVVMRPHGRAWPFPQIGPTWSPICMPRGPYMASIPACWGRGTDMVSCSALRSYGCSGLLEYTRTPTARSKAPYRYDGYRSNGTQGFPLHASRVVRDDSTGSVYLDTITASIERMAIGGPNIDDPATSPATKVVTRWE